MALRTDRLLGEIRLPGVGFHPLRNRTRDCFQLQAPQGAAAWGRAWRKSACSRGSVWSLTMSLSIAKGAVGAVGQEQPPSPYYMQVWAALPAPTTSPQTPWASYPEIHHGDFCAGPEASHGLRFVDGQIVRVKKPFEGCSESRSALLSTEAHGCARNCRAPGEPSV